MSRTTGAKNNASFKDEVEPALRELRESFARLVDASPRPVRRAVEFRRWLGLSAELSWQVFRVASAPEAGAIGALVPKRGSMRRLVEAASAAGVPGKVVDGVERAYEEYERLITRHAGDRGAFDALVESVGAEGGAGVSLKDRRAAFRANRNIWGVQATARTVTAFYVPDAPAGAMNGGVLAGLVDLYAVRPAATLPLEIRIRLDEAGPERSPADAWERTGLLREFSSPGLPALETREEPGDMQHATLRLPGVGRESAVTLYCARFDRAALVPPLGVGTTVRRPCEVLVLDVLVARGAEPRREVATGEVYARIDEVDSADERRPEDLMAWNIAVGTFRDVGGAPPIPEAPRYGAAVASVIERQGWSGLRFDLYRLRVEYPVLHTNVALVLTPPPHSK